MAVIHGGNIFAFSEEKGIDWRQVLDFSASINPLGPSPVAREAILAAVDRIAHYPTRGGDRLRRLLAAQWQLDARSIAVGNGATELLFDWCRMVGPGTIAAPAFGEFHRAWPDAPLCRADDPEGWPDHGPLAVTRPANPTGSVIAAETILRYANARRDPVLVDESFLDFAPHIPSVLPHVGRNLWVLRSLTKFWALPGLRVGALAGDLTGIEAQRPPWALNTLAEEAALASLADSAHAAQTHTFIASESRWLQERLGSLPGLRPWIPTANYIFVETAADSAGSLVRFAAARNVLVRDCTGWPGLDATGIRVAVRKRWENEILLRTLEDCLCA